MADKLWPREGMTARFWFDRMTDYFDAYGTVGRMDYDEDEWQIFATHIVNITSPKVSSIPDPYAYDDWMGWAERMVQVLP